jgi:hypothetical protein
MQHKHEMTKPGESRGRSSHVGDPCGVTASYDATIREMPHTTGLAPAQWRNLMDFAIEKKPSTIRVELIRMIKLNAQQPLSKDFGLLLILNSVANSNMHTPAEITVIS